MDSFRETSLDAKLRGSGPAQPLFSPKPLPLQVRLLVLVAGTLVPMLALTAVIVWQSYERARNAASEQLLQITRSTTIAVDRELQNQIAALEILALSPGLQAEYFEGFRADAERFLTRFPADTAISVADASGKQLFSTNTDPTPTLIRTEVLEAISAVFEQKRAQVSNIYLSRRTNQPSFTVNVPVFKGSEVAFNLAFNAPRSTFSDILTKLELPDGWVVAIFDRKAHHVARRPALPPNVVTSGSPSLQAQFAFGSERVTETTSIEGDRVLTGFTRSPQTGWVVAIGVPVDAFEVPTRRALVTTFSIGFFLILVGGFFGFRIAAQLVRAERHRELLVNELNHRVKNTLASVQAIVWRGLRNSGAAPEIRQGIDARLQALSSAHNVLSNKNWEGAHVEDVIRSIVAPYAGPQGARVRLQGPAVAVHPRIAIALAMVFNELATNAVKYGALSGATGAVAITWSLLHDNRVRLEWVEGGGPSIEPPTRTGYGTKFIERAIVDELNGTYTASFPPEGMRCVIEIAL